MADWAWKWCQISWPRMAKRDDKSHKEDHSHIPSPASLISSREISRCVISLAWGVGLYFPLVKEILCSNTLPRFWTGRPGQWPLVLFIFYPSFYFLFAHNSHARFWYPASHFSAIIFSVIYCLKPFFSFTISSPRCNLNWILFPTAADVTCPRCELCF